MSKSHSLHTAARLHPAPTHLHPRPERIAAFALAITCNGVLLLVLLVPLQAPPILQLPTIIQPLHWVLPKSRPLPPPLPAPIEKPRADPQPTLDRRQLPTPPVPAPVLVEHGSEAAPELPPAPVASENVIDVAPAPLPGVRLQYAHAPGPAYPRAALHARVEGMVLLQVLVDVDGRPLRVDVQHSSGDRRLDAAAREQVLRHWRFRPAIRNGRAVQAIGLVPIAFNLED